MWYVRQGHLSAALLGLLGTIITRSLWPLLGTVLIMGQMHWLYRRAFNRAAERAGEATATTKATDGSNVYPFGLRTR